MFEKDPGLSSYVHSMDKNKYKRKLQHANNFLPHLTKNGGPFGQLVQTLIMSRLMKKASQEENKNKNLQRDLFENYQNNRLKEKEYYKKLAAQLEEKKHQRLKSEEREKEERAARREEQRESRSYERELQKEKRNLGYEQEKQINRDKEKERDEIRSAIIKGFADPFEAKKYFASPERYENSDARKVEDKTPTFSKLIGKINAAVTGKKYLPKKVAIRLK